MAKRTVAQVDGELLAPQSADEMPVKARMAKVLADRTRIARFKGAVIIEENGKWVDTQRISN